MSMEDYFVQTDIAQTLHIIADALAPKHTAWREIWRNEISIVDGKLLCVVEWNYEKSIATYDWTLTFPDGEYPSGLPREKQIEIDSFIGKEDTYTDAIRHAMERQESNTAVAIKQYQLWKERDNA